MFGKAHIIFIIISFLFIFLGVNICEKKKIPVEKVLWVCFFISLASELLKILMVIELVPLVTLVVENGNIVYKSAGKFCPYIETHHIPFQLCSFQIIFLFLARVVKNKEWKRRVYSLIYSTALIGGILAIFLSDIIPFYKSASEFLLSARAWEFYLYHSMLVVIALVIARDKKCGIKFTDAKWTCIIVFILDICSFYMNSMLSVPVYVNEELVGITHSVNFFNSYENNIGLNVTTKNEYFVYLLIRFVVVLLFIIITYLPFLKRKKINNL
ncbi:MAG: YwaF family protein [Lachnospiraceae bacterium]|nr:YwaF family protein [Lachnospiraceae bacterium]